MRVNLIIEAIVNSCTWAGNPDEIVCYKYLEHSLSQVEIDAVLTLGTWSSPSQTVAGVAEVGDAIITECNPQAVVLFISHFLVRGSGSITCQ